MLGNSQVTCWVVTEGMAGMEKQAIDVAEALGLTPVVKRVVPRAPWKQLNPHFRLGLRHAYSDKGDRLTPPWPDLVISCGRGSVVASIYTKKMAERAGRKCVTVHIQNPLTNPRHFDLVITPKHDRMQGPNILETFGGLRHITPQLLRGEAGKLLPKLGGLPSPRIVVLLGGTNRVYKFTPREMIPLSIQLSELAKKTGGSLLVTPSRRTGEANLAILSAALHDVPSYIWNGEGDNPYFGMLGLADYIVVTGDSVNMVSEAAATGKPVLVVPLQGGSARFERFHKLMRDNNYTRPFTGKLEDWSYVPLNDMDSVVVRIRGLLAQNAL